MGDKDRLCAMEPHLPIKKISGWAAAGLEPRTARSAGQHLP